MIIRDTAYGTRYTIGDDLDKGIDQYVEPLLEQYLQARDLFTDRIIRQIIIEYILFSDVDMLGCDIGMVHRTEYDEDMENEIVFTFMAGVKKEEAIEFVNANWDAVQILQKDISHQSKTRLKVSTYFPRDIKIYNTYVKLLSVPTIDRESGYLDMAVQKELKKLDIDISVENIRSVVARIQRLKDSVNTHI